MATYTKFLQFVEDKNHGVHDMANDQLTIALTNTIPVNTNEVIANITEITYTNLSTRNITLTSSAHTGGVYKLTLDDLILTSTSGSTGPFQWVVIYNSTQTTPLGPLVAWYDYGSALTLLDGETLTVDFDDGNGFYTDT
jgi:hypothetical protein